MNPSEAGLGLASRQHSEEACSDVNRRLFDHLLALSLVPPLFRPVRFLALGGAIHRDPARDQQGGMESEYQDGNCPAIPPVHI